MKLNQRLRSWTSAPIAASLAIALTCSPLFAAPPLPSSSPEPEPTVLKGDVGGEYGKPRGLFGNITVGPSMTLFSLPHPLFIGLEGKYKNTAGFEIGHGFIPDIQFRDTFTNIQALSASVRWFPFEGAFFMGMKFGTQKITTRKATDVTYLGQSATVNATVEVNSSFYTPTAGWRWVWNTGFFMGVDFGWQIASGAETDLRTDLRNPVLLASPQYAELEEEVKKVGNDLGNKALPSLTLLHFGWLF